MASQKLKDLIERLVLHCQQNQVQLLTYAHLGKKGFGITGKSAVVLCICMEDDKAKELVNLLSESLDVKPAFIPKE